MTETELPVNLSAEEMPGASEVYQLKFKRSSRHGVMDVTHLRALDREQAVLVGEAYCRKHGFKFVAVDVFCVADSSLLLD